jgi:hypothetical protein
MSAGLTLIDRNKMSYNSCASCILIRPFGLKRMQRSDLEYGKRRTRRLGRGSVSFRTTGWYHPARVVGCIPEYRRKKHNVPATRNKRICLTIRSFVFAYLPTVCRRPLWCRHNLTARAPLYRVKWHAAGGRTAVVGSSVAPGAAFLRPTQRPVKGTPRFFSSRASRGKPQTEVS